MRDTVIRKQAVLARLAEVEEEDSLDSLGVNQGAGQDLHPFELAVRENQSQDTREQARRYQGQYVFGRGGEEEGGGSPVLREAPLQARQREKGERGKEQAVPGYIRRFPVLMRGRTKLEAERSGLDDVVKEVEREGCNKRTAELIEKDLNKMEEILDKYAEQYDIAVGTLQGDKRDKARHCALR